MSILSHFLYFAGAIVICALSWRIHGNSASGWGRFWRVATITYGLSAVILFVAGLTGEF